MTIDEMIGGDDESRERLREGNVDSHDCDAFYKRVENDVVCVTNMTCIKVSVKTWAINP